MARKKIINNASRLEVLLLLFLGLGISTPSKANAQTETLAEPAQITIAGTRGTVVTRNLYLRTADPINKLELIPLDLNRGDGESVLPASTISLENVERDSTQPNSIVTRMKFNLQNANSGEFAGQLRLAYQGGEQIIPVTIRVKDRWFLPLLMLLLGTILGMAVSAYRSQGRPRDEILVRVSLLRAQMQEDAEFAKFKSFKARQDALLTDVRMALQGERWEEAQNIVQQAELVNNKWVKAREDWAAQFDYYEKIKERLAGLDENLPFVQEATRALEDALRDAPDAESPVKLRDRLQEIAEQVNVYLSLQAQLKELLDLEDELSQSLSLEEAKVWQSKVQSLEKRTLSLKAADLASAAELEAALEQAIVEITEALEQSGPVSFGSPGHAAEPRKGKLRGAFSNLLAPPPSTRALTWEEQAAGADRRLQVFTITSYLIAIAFLAGAGFNQLYLDRPTFGDNPWKDYFSLLAWGFGAEATRDAVTKVVQGWGTPAAK